MYVEYDRLNDISVFIRENRKKYGYTQKEFAELTKLGLRFVRELEQGKLNLKMDKVLTALNFFNFTLTVKEKPNNYL